MLDTRYDWHLGSSLTLPSVNMMFPVVCECIENISSTKPLLISDHILIEGLRQGTFSFVVLLRSSVCLKDPH